MNTSSVNEIHLFNVLKGKLGEMETEQLLTFTRDDIKNNVLFKTGHLATKEDLQKTQSKLILWSFAFWATQLAVICGFLKFLYDALV